MKDENRDPHDDEHMRAAFAECSMRLEEAGYTIEKQWNEIAALKDEVFQAKAESAAKRKVIVRLLDALSEIENVPTGCPPIIVDIVHKALVVT